MVLLFFWLSLLLVLFTYGGYAVPLYLLKSRKKTSSISYPLPTVTVVIAAYNEENSILQKLENTFNLNYPKELLSVVVVTDGSTDRTPELAADYDGTKHLFQPERRGKTAALNRAMLSISSDITVFTDANTLINSEALQAMIVHYTQANVGGVSGEKKVVTDTTGAVETEGLYWKYESTLKKMDSDFYSLCGAPGELISFRTSLFKSLPEDTILDDFVLSMEICRAGYRFIYEPNAIATEPPSVEMEDEFERKTRICAGGFQAMSRIGFGLNPFTNFRLWYVYFFHRVMRWAVAPYLLVVAFFTSFLTPDTSFYKFIFLAQSGFYLLAFFGYLDRKRTALFKGYFVPYYFCAMNLAAILGAYRHLMKTQSAIWQKAKR